MQLRSPVLILTRAMKHNRYSTYGRLYNWFAVDDTRGICLIGWHVPSDDEWTSMESHLGLNASEITNTGYRGITKGSN